MAPVVQLRPMLVAFALLAGIFATALPYTPTVRAECHCEVVGCWIAVEAGDPRDRDDNERYDSYEMEEDDPCDDPPGRILAAVYGLLNGGSMSVAVEADGMAVLANGTLVVEPGNFSVAFIAHANSTQLSGNVTMALAPTGFTPTAGGSAPYATTSDPVAEFEYVIDNHAPAMVHIGFTIDQDVGPTIQDTLDFMVGEISFEANSPPPTSPTTSPTVNTQGPRPTGTGPLEDRGQGGNDEDESTAGIEVTVVLLAIFVAILVARRRR